MSFLAIRHTKLQLKTCGSINMHHVKKGIATGSINVRPPGLRFFFKVTLDDANRLKRIKRVNQPRMQPEILSVEEVNSVDDATGSLKYKQRYHSPTERDLESVKSGILRVSDIDRDTKSGLNKERR